jgi:hypothetical protein
MRHCSRHQSLRVSGPASRPEMHFPTEGEEGAADDDDVAPRSGDDEGPPPGLAH